MYCVHSHPLAFSELYEFFVGPGRSGIHTLARHRILVQSAFESVATSLWQIALEYSCMIHIHPDYDAARR
jgi:hypothetical protein